MSGERTQIDRVRMFAKNHAEAKAALDIQIREAREQGFALRTIAEAAGMSYETVRRICTE